MRLLLLAVTCTLLSACPATNPALPVEPVIIPGTVVEVGVREKCAVALPDEPKWQVGATATPDPLERSKAILVELEQRRAWMEKAKVAAKRCE